MFAIEGNLSFRCDLVRKCFLRQASPISHL